MYLEQNYLVQITQNHVLHGSRKHQEILKLLSFSCLKNTHKIFLFHYLFMTTRSQETKS